MSLTNGELSAADVAAVTGNGNNMWGNGDGSFWIFILFLFAMMNGNWGNGGNNNNTYPAIQQGFDQAAITSQLAGINTAVMNGFANAEVGRCNSIANLTNQLNAMAMNQQNCCCENRLATANLGSQVAADGCATRTAFNDAMRDLQYANFVNTQTLQNTLSAGFQSLHDEFCQSRLDAKDDRIADLQRQVEEANDNARYNGLIAAFNQSQESQTTTLEQYLNPTPIPSYIVPNPNGCNCNTTCGCGSF